MRNVATILAGVLALAVTPALAAGISTNSDHGYVAPPAATGTPFDWSGMYFGVNGGYASGNLDWTYDVSQSHADQSTSGGVAGVTAGFNTLHGPWLFGVEGDLDWADISGSASCPTPLYSCNSHLQWLATARARVGFTKNNWLFYGTGGLAAGGVRIETVTRDGSPQPSSGTPTNGSSSTDVGWVLGVGTEVQLHNMWSVKFDWLHYDLGASGHTVDHNLAVTVDETGNIFRLGLNRHF